MIKDKDQNIWFSTNRGLYRFEEYENLGSLNHYKKKDGLQGDEFNTGALAIDTSKNRIFFGGLNGITSFFPIPKINKTRQQRDIIYYYPETNSEITYSYADSIIELPNEFKFIKIKPLIYNFQDPYNNQFKYSVCGEKWKLSTKNELTLTKEDFGSFLQPHLLKLQLRTGKGTWDSINEKNVAIYISLISFKNLALIIIPTIGL